MLFRNFAIFLFFCAASLYVSQSHASCMDDERLYAIGDFLKSLDSGGVVQPLRLTPETYLNLTPGVRQRIGDHLVILDESCRPVQVFAGEPPVRIMMSFPVIYGAFVDAVLRGDTVTQNIVLRSFKAAPVTPAEFMSLLTVITENDLLTNQLSRAAGIPPHDTKFSGDSRGDGCNSSKMYLMFADLFVRFGGQVDGRNGPAWVIGGYRHALLSLDDDVVIYPYRFFNGCLQHRQASLSAAKAAGATVFNLGGHGVNLASDAYVSNKRVRELWFDRYNRWVKADSPEEIPATLFD
ncbi:hypothetical protein SAMN05421693_12512 [Ectothiorhodospira magna]|uniref:Uncharacterized protein n=1 Tax=Ectothiorhodospira magna TaxID=867345 RepID=A0A1H9FA92_9GAMM|nr:hypothetical protein [Ectothiorhodospira magna]SEQ34218.1 hypothetical protein SAMN05421693_12512 [Ectothiorhodospira magna]